MAKSAEEERDRREVIWTCRIDNMCNCSHFVWTCRSTRRQPTRLLHTAVRVLLTVLRERWYKWKLLDLLRTLPIIFWRQQVGVKWFRIVDGISNHMALPLEASLSNSLNLWHRSIWLNLLLHLFLHKRIFQRSVLQIDPLTRDERREIFSVVYWGGTTTKTIHWAINSIHRDVVSSHTFNEYTESNSSFRWESSRRTDEESKKHRQNLSCFVCEWMSVCHRFG